MERPFDDWAINLAQFRGREFVFYTYHDAIRTEEVLNGRAFAKKLGIRGHAKFNIVAPRVGIQRTTKLQAGAGRDGALLNHQLRRTSFLRNLPSHVVDSGKIGLPAGLRRRAHANENDI